MIKNIRTELFFLKQFGFNSSFLQTIFILQLNPLEIIFYEGYTKYSEVQKRMTKKDFELSEKYERYVEFKKDVYSTDDFLKNSNSKIYFKYDQSIITELIPEKIMPLFMYALGDVSLLKSDQKKVAIVGTRKPSKKAIEMTKRLTKKYVKDNYVIVSGLAEGIDTISHETAILNNGKTIAVLPTNFNTIYPKQNKDLAIKILEEGLLLTSIGPRENTYKSSFLDRNQYVANISDIVIVTETNLKSGTMNTIRNASEAKKRILFVDQENESINNKILSYGGEIIV